MTKEQKIAEFKSTYLKWLEKNPFAQEYVIETEVLDTFLSELQTLQTERDKLINGLRFYANENHWRGGLSMRSSVNVDGGELAQTILKEIGVNLDDNG